MKRVPNQITFAYVSADGSKIDGKRTCTDAQWDAILHVLINKPVDFRPAPKQEGVSE